MLLTRSRRVAAAVGDPKSNGHRPAPTKRTEGSGHRRFVLAGRMLLWAAILLLAVRGGVGVVAELAGDAGPRTAPVRGQVMADESVFPADAARAFATRFAQDYLTYDAASGRAERAERLAAYVPPGAARDLGWDGTGDQLVRTALPVEVRVVSDERAVVTVAAQMEAGHWLHLAVPVAADAGGGLTVAAPPALVAGPPPADVPSASWTPAARSSGDVPLAEELTPVLESFFEAYAEGRPDALAYYLAVGQDLDGLGGLVELDDLVSLWIDRGGTSREAVATVRWRAPDGGVLTQRYALTLVDVAGRWYVDALRVGEDTGDDEEGSRS